MAGTLSEQQAIALIDTLLDTGGSGVYIALSTTNPLADGSGITEPSGDGYARVNTTDFAAAAETGGVVEALNDALIEFANPTAGWGTISHFAIFDAITAGNLLWVGEIVDAFDGTPTPVAVLEDAPPRFSAGALRVAIDLTYGP